MSTHAPGAVSAAMVPAGVVEDLARQVETVRGALERLREMPTQVQELARVVGALAEQVHRVSAVACPAEAAAPRSWLALDRDGQLAHQTLVEVVGWVGEVYLRYADAVVSFPDCWLWHPDVVEELLCLMGTWHSAYCGPTACTQAAGEWHERSRPGTVRRIKTLAGTCSLDNHHSHPGHPLPGEPVVPLAEALAPIADWWAHRRTGGAPEPTRAHLDAAATAGRAHRGGHR